MRRMRSGKILLLSSNTGYNNKKQSLLLDCHCQLDVLINIFPETSPPSVRCVRGKTVSDIKPSIKSRLENARQFELLVVSSPWCCLTHSVLLKNKHYRPSDHYVEFKQPIYTTIASLLACFLPHNNCVKMNATFRLLAQTGEPLIFDVAGGIMYVVICVAGRESVGKGGLRVK